MGSFRDLSKNMRRIAKGLPKQFDDLAKGTALAVVTDLAINTPVDTSKAISNWKVTLIAPYPLEVEPYYPGFSGSTYTKTVSETIADAERNISKRRSGETIFITNNADYIIDLNDGSSKQEPAGFVQRAVIVGNEFIKKYKFKF